MEKPLRAPVVLVVSARAGRDEIETLENRYAVAAGVQNLLLAAHAKGRGAMWRSGRPAYSRAVAEYLRFEPEQRLVPAVDLGWPDCNRTSRRDLSGADCTTWRGWD